jgi:hypothetical protein
VCVCVCVCVCVFGVLTVSRFLGLQKNVAFLLMVGLWCDALLTHIQTHALCLILSEFFCFCVFFVLFSLRCVLQQRIEEQARTQRAKLNRINDHDHLDGDVIPLPRNVEL